ncbi:hypothetical protein GOD84_28835 [Sinorhizobium medicae]|nr:hypothetical protein [Sinorhizobium medicae]MDX0710315.1 hypothetical protein [Sinorhizobium medicae]
MNVAVKKGDADKVRLDFKGLLAEKGIVRVLFIDDAFEPVSNFEPTEIEAGEIWSAIQEKDDLISEAAERGIASQEELTADIIKAVREGQESDLRALFDQSDYVTHHTSKLDRLKPAMESLTAAEIDVRTAGREDWEDKLDGVNIVFLDWYLGVDGKQEAIDKASTTARKIHSSPHKPLIVLISSDPAVKNDAPTFRESSKLIGGLFDAMPKQWLADQHGIILQMTALADIFSKGHVVQAFVDNLNSQTAGAIKAFTDVVQELTLSDYANLQHFALKKDGHPLGDYLVNLLTGLWSDALFRGDLKKSLKDLDRQDFASLPAFSEPSSAFAKIYNSAVFDMHVEDFGPHPQQDPEKNEEAGLHLSLGDLIVAEGEKPEKVFIIMNPECDLAASPRGKRVIPGDQSILLLPGDLVPIDHADRSARKTLPDTPFFVLDEKQKFRIHWNITGLHSVPYGDFKAWLGSKKRRACMRPLYILSLQQAVHAHLTRVGLPSPPPLYEGLTTTLKSTFGGKFLNEDVTLQQGKYVMARDTEDDQVAFTTECVNKIKELVVKGVAKLAASNVAKDAEYKAAIETALLEPEEWGQVLRPFKLPRAGAKFFGDSVFVCREDKATEAQLSRKTLVCVVVK